MSRTAARALFLVLFAVVWVQLLRPAFREPNFGIEHTADDRLIIRDFAAHQQFARSAWTEGARYDVDSHVQITRQWAGKPVRHALPFGYSPTMLFVLAPFCLLPGVWAYAAWTLLGCLAVWWLIEPVRAPSLIGAIFFLSPLSIACLALGQTAILATAALVFLIQRSRAGEDDGKWDWPSIMMLWALTAKPPVALSAGVALLAVGKWRWVLSAVGLTLVTSALATPLLGTAWVTDYWQLITHYDKETAPPDFAWSFRPEFMSNLRAVVHVGFGFSDHYASVYSTVGWIGCLVATGIVAKRSDRLKAMIGWSGALLSYLLGCPHLTATEDLNLFAVIALLWMGPGRVESRFGTAIALIATALVYCSPAFGPLDGFGWLPVVFGGKIMLGGLIWAHWNASRRTRSEACAQDSSPR